MKNTQKGFASILLILLGLVVIGGGIYVYTQQKASVNLESTTSIKTTPTSVSTDDKEVMEIKVNQAKETINDSVDKKLVVDATVKSDVQGNQIPSLIMDPEVASDLVVESQSSNPTYARQLVLIQTKAMIAGVRAYAEVLKDKEGSYKNVCDMAKTYLKTEVDGKINSGDEFDDALIAKLGITTNSYRVAELVCASDESKYIISIPVTLEDSTATKFCTDSTGFANYGTANLEKLTCVKK